MIQKTLIISYTIKPVKTELIYNAILPYTENFYDPSRNNAMQFIPAKTEYFSGSLQFCLGRFYCIYDQIKNN